MDNKIVIAVKGLIINRGRFLIIKRANDDQVGPGTWETVGGKIEFGEELESALIREAKEEAGIDIIVEKLLYATTFQTSPTRQVVVLIYLCRTEQDKVTLSAEHSGYLWATKAKLREYLPPMIVTDFVKYKVFELEEIE